MRTGTLEQRLEGHARAVVALVACRQQLISSSMDKTVRVWSMETWACVRTVQEYAASSAQFIRSLAVSGPTLVGGSCSKQTVSAPHLSMEKHKMLVWDLETLEPVFSLRQAADQSVFRLASHGGELWGQLGRTWWCGGGGVKEAGCLDIAAVATAASCCSTAAVVPESHLRNMTCLAKGGGGRKLCCCGGACG